MATTKTDKAESFATAVQGGVVAVEVGPQRVKYFVHKALLEEHSEYFKKALNGSWKEAEEKAVCLDDVDCRSFKVFVGWLYTRKLPTKTEDWVQRKYQISYDTSDFSKWYTDRQLAMLKAYVLADRMISQGLRQALKHELIDEFFSGCIPMYAAITYAFSYLSPSSEILGAMIAAHCHYYDETYDTEENGGLQLRTQLPNAFLLGVIERFAKLRSEDRAKLDKHRVRGDEDSDVELDRCEYHNHATDKEKKKCRKAFARRWEEKQDWDSSWSDSSESD